MRPFTTMPPSAAIEVVTSYGIRSPGDLIIDHAAAGLVRATAMVIESEGSDGIRSIGHDEEIECDIWKRVVRQGATHGLWSTATLRLGESHPSANDPVVTLTGIGFSAIDIHKIGWRQRGYITIRQNEQLAEASTLRRAELIDDSSPASRQPAAPSKRRGSPDLSRLHTGALVLTVAETKAALSIGHTTLYKLLNAGELERAPSRTGTRITVVSVRRYAGLQESAADDAGSGAMGRSYRD